MTPAAAAAACRPAQTSTRPASGAADAMLREKPLQNHMVPPRAHEKKLTADLGKTPRSLCSIVMHANNSTCIQH